MRRTACSSRSASPSSTRCSRRRSRAAAHDRRPAASAARPIFWGSKFCAQCGRPVGAAPPQPAESADEQHRAPRDYCPHCGVAYEPLQEYCLECGARLPTNRGVVGVLASSWQRRLCLVSRRLDLARAALPRADDRGDGGRRRRECGAQERRRRHSSRPSRTVTVGPGRRSRPASTATVTSTLPGAPAPTITTGPLPTAPGRTGDRPHADARANPNALAVWPAGKSGYTDVLESLPVADGRANAVARGPPGQAGAACTTSASSSRSQYSSLHPGYYVVFAGHLSHRGRGRDWRSADAHANGFPDAYQTRVTR